MKKKILIAGSIIAMLFTLNSCEKAVLEDNGTNVENTERVTQVVTLNLAAETAPMVGLARTPLTNQIVYGINVYAKKPEAVSYSKYAYGVFTDPSKTNIEIPEGYRYKFEVVALQDDEQKVFHEGSTYKYPFVHSDTKEPTAASNSFVMSTSDNLPVLKENVVSIVGNEEGIKVPRIFKYYGVLQDYDPTSGTDPALMLKKVVYGLHFNITPPKDGVLKLSYNNNEVFEIKAGEEAFDRSFIYPFSKLDDAIAEGYSIKLTLHLTWTRNDGSIYEDTKLITLKRNLMVNVAIDAAGPDPRHFTITLDNSEMEVENLEWHLKAK